MPQFGRPTPLDAATSAEQMDAEVMEGIPLAGNYLTTTAQIRRLGVDRVSQIAEQAGKPRSKRTIRRWRHDNRVPDPGLTELIKRADQIERLGGVDQAASQVDRSPASIERFLTDPNKIDPTLRRALHERDLAESRVRAGIPVKHDGSLARLPKLRASGNVWVKGASEPETYRYRAHRNVNILLDRDTAESVLAAMDARNPQAAREAAEAYLSDHLAVCHGYGDDYGWHFEDLDEFTLDWTGGE